MPNPIEQYWNIKLEKVKEKLENNNFEAHIVDNAEEAHRLVMGKILTKYENATVSFGGSMSVVGAGVYEALKKSGQPYNIIDTFDHTLPDEKKWELRRQALLSDVFITGTNALTEDGTLVNLDAFGNRVAALAFGPHNVVVIVGRNKVVADESEAIARIKDYAAPVNNIRLGRKTPCTKTASCHDCNSPDRICNVWTINEKSFPAGRIKVILVNDDLGF
ncbi:MAG: lactate utilization protein [Desulfovibrio sp.]